MWLFKGRGASATAPNEIDLNVCQIGRGERPHRHRKDAGRRVGRITPPSVALIIRVITKGPALAFTPNGLHALLLVDCEAERSDGEATPNRAAERIIRLVLLRRAARIRLPYQTVEDCPAILQGG